MDKILTRSSLMATAIAVSLLLGLATPAWAQDGIYVVECRGGAEGLVTSDGDLFSHFPSLIPGDVVSGSVSILNNSDSEQEVFFYTEPTKPSGNEKVDELLYLLQLRITLDGSEEALYEGAIHADEMNEPVSIGVFAPGEGTTLHFEVSVPVSIGNEYISLGNQVHWVFAVPDNSPDEESTSPFDQTGDPVSRIIPLFLLAAAVSGTAIAILVRRAHN